MPPSKQARARQARQKERLAAAAVRRQGVQRRRRRLASIGAIVLIVAIVLALVAGATRGGNNKAATPTTGPATTTAVVTSAKGKPCVAMNGTPPKGAPSVPVQVGPPPTKLVVKDLEVGTGAAAKATSTISASYIGVACSTGKIFGSSFTDGQDFTGSLSGGVIPGWTQGIPGMKVGGRRLLGIPSDLAYGPESRGSDIAADEALWFVIDLKSVT